MPAKKLDFRVVNVSTEDEKFPATDLNSDKHGPLVQGWIAQKFCLYPVDIIIQFNKRITLKKVQLLSHQYLIASRIEFYIGDCLEGEPDFQTAKYTRLGYVELSSNERTDYKARELKSVHVDAEGTFLKLVLHKNFLNRLNMCNQVGLVAVNVIGIDSDDDSTYSYLKQEGETDPVVLAAMKKQDHISPLDDLAFAMYQDPEISTIIRSLDKKKAECVLKEKYDEAKRLKQAISELYKIGERLARYEIEKRQAIEEEDYERAKIKKQQIQEYRSDTYKQLNENGFLDFIEPEARENLLKKATYINYNDSINDYATTDNKSSRNSKDNLESSRYSDKDSKSPPPTSHRSTTRAGGYTSKMQQQYQLSPRTNLPEKPLTPYEDRVIPTLRHRESRQEKNFAGVSGVATGEYYNTETEPLNNSGGGSGNGEEISGVGANDSQVPDQQDQQKEEFEQEMYDPLDGTEEMTEREVREAALMNDYLGKQIVTKLYSKNFQNREDALQEIYTNLSNYTASDKPDAKSLMRASAILVAKMFKDNVYSIFQHSIKLLHFLLTEFAPRHSLGKTELNYVLEKALPVLLHRSGDTNARLRQRAHEYIVEMATLSEIRPLHTVPHFCTIPFNLHIAPRLALSRVEIVENLMKQLGTKDNGLTVDTVSKFCSLALEHTSGEVRELATKVLIQMYREDGVTVRRYLPQDNEMNRRNKKYRILFDAFDSIDGKPIRSNEYYDRPPENPVTPRFSRNIRTPSKSKTNLRAPSLDRKTPTSFVDESEFGGENTCMFCGEVNDKFLKQGLDVHYWKSCPMLKQCNECKQIIEIAVQNEHLLTECSHKTRYKKCPRCNEAVNVNNQAESDHHFKTKQCAPFDKRMNRCPLCHQNIPLGEETWKEHLMSSQGGCSKNARRPSIAAPSGATDHHRKSNASSNRK